MVLGQEKFTYAHWPDCCYLLTADGDATADRKLKAFGPLTPLGLVGLRG